jgi:hypothetical protein
MRFMIIGVKRGPNLAADGETEVEIRKLLGVEDFGADFTPNPDIAKVKITLPPPARA